MYTEAVAVLVVDYLWAPLTLPLIVYTNKIRLLSVCDVTYFLRSTGIGEILQILVMYNSLIGWAMFQCKVVFGILTPSWNKITFNAILFALH